MIVMSELLKGKKLEEQTPLVQANLAELLLKVSKLRKAYGKSMVVSSGLRSLDEHVRIYADKGIRDLKLIPMKSLHLSGLAVDFADPDNRLKDFINDNLDLVEEIGLYFEDFKVTSNWIHVQIVSPKSGKRFFVP